MKILFNLKGAFKIKWKLILSLPRLKIKLKLTIFPQEKGPLNLRLFLFYYFLLYFIIFII